MTLFVLVPASLGFHVFIRSKGNTVRRLPARIPAEDIGSIRYLAPPDRDGVQVVMVGTSALDTVERRVRDFAELYAIPARWFATLPCADIAGRAALATRLIAHHRLAPIRYRPSRYDFDDIPF